MFHAEHPVSTYLDCDVIILQLDKVSSADLLVQYFKSPSVHKWLRRVVIDKAHMLLANNKYYDVIEKLTTVFDQDVPRIFLYSLLDLEDQYALKNKVSITDWIIHRETTIRKDIEHVVINTTNAEDAINKIYLEEIKPSKAKAIILSNNSTSATALAKQLGCLVLHDDMSPDEISEVYKEMNSAESSLLVATAKINNGIVIPKVAHVLTIGGIQNIIEIQQFVGRLWNGENIKGKHYILTKCPMVIEDVASVSCINKVFSEKLDNKMGNCNSLQCVKCSFCNTTKVIEENIVDLEPNINEVVPVRTLDDCFQDLRKSGLNPLRLCGLNPTSNCVREELGCSSDTLFLSLIDIGDIGDFKDMSICFSCLFGRDMAKRIDPNHVEGMDRCSLRGLGEAFVLVKIYERGLEELECMVGPWEAIPKIIFLHSILNLQPKFKKIFEKLQYTPRIERILVPDSDKFIVSRYLVTKYIDCFDLVYEGRGGQCKLSEARIQELLKSAGPIEV